jgi:hypothetical protein
MGNTGASGAGWSSFWDDAKVVESVPSVTFSPGGGVYAEDQSVVISCTTSGAAIYYTTDGSTPTQNSIQYVGPVLVDHSMTLKAGAWSNGSSLGLIRSEIYVLARPRKIFHSGTITIDGNLADWATSEWVPLDQTYNGDPIDITEAYYAAKWNATSNKVYVAVKVRDTAHKFTDGYDLWNSRDAVEIYLHTTGVSADKSYPNSEPAQQLSLGIMNTNRNAVWASLGGKDMLAGYTLQAAGKEVGEWIYYEVSMTPYEYMGAFASLPSNISTLAEGQVIGLDVVVVGNNSAYTGAKSENLLEGKYANYDKFGLHKLTLRPGDANGDGAVDVGDLGILAANYGGTDKGWTQGDFNGDHLVDVGDLGILAAHYGEGSTQQSNFSTDYANAFGTTVTDDTENNSMAGNSICGALGLPLMVGLLLAGLMLYGLKVKE